MFRGFSGLDKAKTFRPRRTHRVGTKRYELHKYAQATLGTGNLYDAVTLPPGEDLNEWLAMNTVDFFNEINLLYGVIAEFCTEATCPVRRTKASQQHRHAQGAGVCSATQSLLRPPAAHYDEASVARLWGAAPRRGPSHHTATSRQSAASRHAAASRSLRPHRPSGDVCRPQV